MNKDISNVAKGSYVSPYVEVSAFCPGNAVLTGSINDSPIDGWNYDTSDPL